MPLLISTARRASRQVEQSAARRAARPCGGVRGRTGLEHRSQTLDFATPGVGMVELRTPRVVMWHTAPPLGRHHHAEAVRGRVGPERRTGRPEGTSMRRRLGAE